MPLLSSLQEVVDFLLREMKILLLHRYILVEVSPLPLPRRVIHQGNQPHLLLWKD